MTEIRVEVLSNDILRTLNLAEHEIDQIVAAAAEHGASLIRTAVQTRSPSSGPQTRYQPKRTVFPAAEGNAPNTDTGNLVNSVQHEAAGSHSRLITIGAEYAEALEYGGWPFVTPSADQLAKDMPRIVEAGLRILR